MKRAARCFSRAAGVAAAGPLSRKALSLLSAGCAASRAAPLRLAPARCFAAAALPPHTKLAMPALSPTMTAGTIIKWHKQPGDALNPGDLIAEVGTDKATVDFECQDSGYMAKILVPDGTADVQVGRIIAIMVDTADVVAAFQAVPAELLTGEGAAPLTAAPPAPAAAPAARAPAAAPVAAPAAATPSFAAPSQAASAASAGGRVIASPLAKKLAADAGLPANALSSLAGTGPNGRIIAADVKEALAAGTLGARAAAPVAAAAPAPAAAAGAASPAHAPAAAAAGPITRGAYVDVPHSQMRRVIAQRLTASKQTVPHYTLTSELSLDALLALRASLNADLPAAGKLSLNDFIVKASALALRRVPEMNSSWLDSGIRAYDYVDVAVAVATEGGLITPIVKDADHKGLSAISSTVRALAEKAKAGKLAPEEYQGGTFTISNLGMYGIRTFSAIINPPQAGILAVGAAERKVVPDTAAGAAAGAFKQSVVLSATLSCDHRVVDGAVGAQWLAAFKGYIESPTSMLL